MFSIKYRFRSVLFFGGLIIVLSTLVAGLSYYFNTKLTYDQLAAQSIEIVNTWSKEITTEEVVAMKQHPDRYSPVGKKLENHLNEITMFQPHVAQAYIFGTELRNGLDCTMISVSTSLLELDPKVVKFEYGGWFTQPLHHAEMIKEMKETKKIVVSKPYNDKITGTWITVMKPYFNDKGEVFAYYAIDYDASHLVETQHQMFILIGVSLFILIILFVVLNTSFYNKNAQLSLEEEQVMSN